MVNLYCELYGFQMNMAYKSIDSDVWDIRVTPFLTGVYIAKVTKCILMDHIRHVYGNSRLSM